MIRISRTLVIVCALVVFSVIAIEGKASAAFLLLQDFSGETTGQAGAVTAAGGRPSTTYANAANLSFIDGMNFELGTTIYIPSATFTDSTGKTTDSEVKAKIAPNFFSSLKATDWLTFGLAAFPNFGKILAWPEDWDGAHVVIRNDVGSMTINPNVAFGPFHGFAVAVGFDATWAELKYSRSLTVGTNPIGEEDVKNQAALEGQAWAYSFNAGVGYQPVEWVRLGLAYRMGYDLDFEGVFDFDTNSNWAWRFPDQDFDTTLTMPHQVSFGARFWPIETFSIEMDVWYYSWSDYESQTINMDPGLYEGPGYQRTVDDTPQNLTDGFLISIGSEWWFHEYVAGRLGMGYDHNVTPDETVSPVVPDGSRLQFAGGIGVEYKGFYADIAYKFEYMLARTVEDAQSRENTTVFMNGDYQLHKHALSFSLGYHFDPFAKDEAEEEPEEYDEADESDESLKNKEEATEETDTI